MGDDEVLVKSLSWDKRTIEARQLQAARSSDG